MAESHASRCPYCRGSFPEELLRLHGGFCSPEHAEAFQAGGEGAQARGHKQGHCQWCGEPLPLLARLKGERFCGEEHEKAHYRQQADSFLERIKKYRRQGGGSKLRSETSKILIRPRRQKEEPEWRQDELPPPKMEERWSESAAADRLQQPGGAWRFDSRPPRGFGRREVPVWRAGGSYSEPGPAFWRHAGRARVILRDRSAKAGNGGPGRKWVEFSRAKGYHASHGAGAMQGTPRPGVWMPLAEGTALFGKEWGGRPLVSAGGVLSRGGLPAGAERVLRMDLPESAERYAWQEAEVQEAAKLRTAFRPYPARPALAAKTGLCDERAPARVTIAAEGGMRDAWTGGADRGVAIGRIEKAGAMGRFGRTSVQSARVMSAPGRMCGEMGVGRGEGAGSLDFEGSGRQIRTESWLAAGAPVFRVGLPGSWALLNLAAALEGRPGRRSAPHSGMARAGARVETALDGGEAALIWGGASVTGGECVRRFVVVTQAGGFAGWRPARRLTEYWSGETVARSTGWADGSPAGSGWHGDAAPGVVAAIARLLSLGRQPRRFGLLLAASQRCGQERGVSAPHGGVDPAWVSPGGPQLVSGGTVWRLLPFWQAGWFWPATPFQAVSPTGLLRTPDRLAEQAYRCEWALVEPYWAGPEVRGCIGRFGPRILSIGASGRAPVSPLPESRWFGDVGTAMACPGWAAGIAAGWRPPVCGWSTPALESAAGPVWFAPSPAWSWSGAGLWMAALPEIVVWKPGLQRSAGVAPGAAPGICREQTQTSSFYAERMRLPLLVCCFPRAGLWKVGGRAGAGALFFHLARE